MNLGEFAKRKFLSVISNVLKQAKESFLENLDKVILIYKSFELAVDCARTQGFNFEGIVKEAFESLGVGQGEDCNIFCQKKIINIIIFTIIIVILWSSLSSI